MKTVVLIQIMVEATCFNPARFKMSITLKAKTKTSFFSHLCQHSAPLSLSTGLAVNQKGVLGVRGLGWECTERS